MSDNNQEPSVQADLAKNIYDICIIGGGINGAGIARDVAGQGWRVVLLEKDDLAQATSSASSKFIHGGLRYLEYYAFNLVRKALLEREKLIKIAPHIIQPLPFILPHNENMRPKWLIRMGLYLYDLLAGRSSFPRSKYKSWESQDTEIGLKDHLKDGFLYYDCSVDDARLVVSNAMSARQLGAEIITYDGCDYISAETQNKLWRVRLSSGRQIWAKAIVNAAGPWVRNILGENGLIADHKVPKLRLVRGSHIVVPKLYDAEHAYILQKADGRIVFTWPYYGYTAVGTTDVDMGRDPDRPVHISDDEKDYLLKTINDNFTQQYTVEDIVNHWSGVRALADDDLKEAKSASRDYKIHHSTVHGLPVLSVFGGKITTYRKLAEDVIEKLGGIMGANVKYWTADEPLSGGALNAENDLKSFIETQWKRYPWLPQGLILRYCKSYGRNMDLFLGQATSLEDLGQDLGHNVFEKEIDYLVEHEWAKELEDIIWRRSKLGLLNDKTMEDNIRAYLLKRSS